MARLTDVTRPWVLTLISSVLVFIRIRQDNFVSGSFMSKQSVKVIRSWRFLGNIGHGRRVQNTCKTTQDKRCVRLPEIGIRLLKKWNKKYRNFYALFLMELGLKIWYMTTLCECRGLPKIGKSCKELPGTGVGLHKSGIGLPKSGMGLLETGTGLPQKRLRDCQKQVFFQSVSVKVDLFPARRCWTTQKWQIMWRAARSRCRTTQSRYRTTANRHGATPKKIKGLSKTGISWINQRSGWPIYS